MSITSRWTKASFTAVTVPAPFQERNLQDICARPQLPSRRALVGRTKTLLKLYCRGSVLANLEPRPHADRRLSCISLYILTHIYTPFRPRCQASPRELRGSKNECDKWSFPADNSGLPVWDSGPIQQGARVEPNHVYVIPPNADLSLTYGELLILSRKAPISCMRKESTAAIPCGSTRDRFFPS